MLEVASLEEEPWGTGTRPTVGVEEPVWVEVTKLTSGTVTV